MAGSQLKRLKASLKTAGVIGQPQASKKSKKQSSNKPSETRLTKEAKLQSIREEFNPFEIKKNREKHSVSGGRKIKGTQGRPGLSKQVGEEIRKNTLLVEMQRRGKVGGIVDKRIGENDPSMAPEDRMLQRFTMERQRRSKNGDIFNLEDDITLTHYGQSLGTMDDFTDEIPLNSDEEGDGMGEFRRKKRALPLEDGGRVSDAEDEEDGKPPRKKSKAEVMKEVIAKSKLHKYERQDLKDKDEDLREELDAELKDIQALLRGIPMPKPKPKELEKVEMTGISADRLAAINASTPASLDKLYDQKVREMTYDRRSKPSDRTKSAEEQAELKAKQLEKLEKNRMRRMRGELESDEEDGDGDGDVNEDDEFGIGAGMKIAPEESEFVHGSEGESESEEESESESENESESEQGEDNENMDAFLDELEVLIKEPKATEESRTHGEDDLSDDYNSDASDAESEESESESEPDELEEQIERPEAPTPNKALLLSNGSLVTNDEPKFIATPTDNATLAYTFPCPQTHAEFKAILKNVNVKDYPTVVQRIRVLHHSSLHPGNKEKLAVFTTVLLTHTMYLADNNETIPFDVLETLIRHIHSLIKVHSQTSATSFRDQWEKLHKSILDRKQMSKGYMMLLVATSIVFPTSDAWHLVITPATLVMGQYLETFPPVDMESLVKGTFVVTICAQFQSLSKRVVPEAINFISQALTVLSPKPVTVPGGSFSVDQVKYAGDSLRLSRDKSFNATDSSLKLKFNDAFSSKQRTEQEILALKSQTLVALNSLLLIFSDQYRTKTAFIEIFTPASTVLAQLTSHRKQFPPNILPTLTKTSETLSNLIIHALDNRRALELHHHRPLAIPENIPKFQEGYSLDRFYDPDKDRKELAKLKTEHKRERKGAMRELRKDASFVAREKLRERKEADGEYHKKMKRIVGMINSEEGKEGREYEREKRDRKGKKGN